MTAIPDDMDELLDALAAETKLYIDERLDAQAQELRTYVDARGLHKDSVKLTIRELLDEALEKAVAALPRAKDGRDVLDLEILEVIEAGKSYPAGTFALHDGGMAIAFRDTDPIESSDDISFTGWRVAQEGIKAIASEPVDERTHRVVVTTTSGKRFPLEFVTSYANIDKGVYRPGMKYLVGQGVTHDLGYWIAQRDTHREPPHADWRLAIKGKFRR